MKSIIENAIYQSERPFLTEAEIQVFLDRLKGLSGKERVVFLGKDLETTSKWTSRIMDLGLPNWIDPEGNTWVPHDVSPQFHMCCYFQGGKIGKHLDRRYFNEDNIKEQFKFLIYLDNSPSATRIYMNPKTKESSLTTKQYTRIIPRKGHVVYYHLDLWHEGELVESKEKALIGFRVRYRQK